MRTLNFVGLACLCLSVIGVVWAVEPRGNGPLHEFARAELGVTTAAVPLKDALPDLPNRTDWEKFVAREGPGASVQIDPRSGRPASIATRVPFIPGTGDGNQVSLVDVEAELGRPIAEIGPEEIGELVLKYVQTNRNVFGVDARQLGPVSAAQVNPELWQVSVPQVVQDVPVRHARIVASIGHGNLVLIGTSMWGDVRTSTRPKVDADEATRIGLEFASTEDADAVVTDAPRLELLPIAPAGREKAYERGRKMLGGYGHRLAWIIVVTAGPDAERWEIAIDGHSGEVISSTRLEREANKTVKGSIFTPAGFESGAPMPWADTGFAAPKNYTFGSGVYDYTSGTATTTLNGKYIRIIESCPPDGVISKSSSNGNIDLGGTAQHHECDKPSGDTAGNTSAARTTYYEANKIAEIARGWLPSNTWLTSQLTAKTNHGGSPCNAFWDGTDISFRKGTGCGNPGEISSIIAHEWGHGLDDNDTYPTISGWSEAYADIAALYRTQQSCLGRGSLITSNSLNDKGCSTDQLDLFNQNEAQVGSSHCDLDCSGMRDADYAMHADGTADTPQNFVFDKCASLSGGPCGREEHCGTTAVRQAAWDLAARDLQAAPFNYDATTAFAMASRLFYLGSGNVNAWHNCDPVARTSDGCSADNGYNLWLTADDDDGYLGNGTPHMTAIYNAFNRHGIACATPTLQNSGCSGGPSSAPTLTATARCGAVDLSWTSVSGATRYRVLRGEGPGSCDMGKALLGTPIGTSFQDRNLQNGRDYCYNIMPLGAYDTCSAPASSCVCVTPAANKTDTDTPVVKVTYPNGGNTLAVNTSVTITWEATDSCGVSSVDLLLSRTGVGGSYSTLFSSQSNTGSKAWTVTNPATTNAFFKVVARDAVPSTGSDTSDSAVTITCGACQASYCSTEGVRCTWDNTCGGGGCCNYTCVSDPTCIAADQCPSSPPACHC